MTARASSSLVATITAGLVNDRLENGMPVMFHVPTTSMIPTLLPGDRVVVASKPINYIPLGSLLVLYWNNSYIVHRLIRRVLTKTGCQLITKGDHCTTADPVWENDSIVGVVQAVVRNGRHIEMASLSKRLVGYSLAVLSALEADLSAVSGNRTPSPPIWFFRRLIHRIFYWFASGLYTGDHAH